MKEVQGIRIGLFGIMGKDAAEVSPFARPLKFKNPIETAREMVKHLRENERANLVICLSHSGLNEKKSRSEDELLAKEVSGIDVIVSGHTHTKLVKPLVVNHTIIVQAYAHGRNVGILDLTYENGQVKLKDYALIDVDDRIPGDETLQKKIESYIRIIDRTILKNLGLSFYQRIAKEEGYLPLDYSESNKTLYRVAANLYNATFLNFVGRFTYRLLEIVPKDRNGHPIVSGKPGGQPFRSPPALEGGRG